MLRQQNQNESNGALKVEHKKAGGGKKNGHEPCICHVAKKSKTKETRVRI